MTTATAPRVHPGPYELYPAGTPPLEQLPAEFRDHGHTAETWEAYIRHPAMTGADALFAEIETLEGKVRSWLRSFGDLDDPGITAIEAAGLPVPEYLQRWGSHMASVADQFRGLAWALESAADNVRDQIPDTGDEQCSPANVRRLLGVEEPAVVVEAARPTTSPTFLSADCTRLIRAVADHGPVAVKEIVRLSGVDRTKAYILVGDLRERGLIRDTDDGFELATPAVRDLLVTLPTAGGREAR